MLKRSICLLSALLMIYFLQCGLLQPEPEKGSLVIKPAAESTEPGLLKTNEALNSIKCTLVKGAETKYDQSITTKQNGNFSVHITELEAADNYSLLLYGYNSNDDMIGRFAQSNISIRAGEETPVAMTWTKFKPDLLTPANAITIEDNTPALDWSDVSGATAYELMVALTNTFANPAIQQAGLTVSGYTITTTLPDGVYYWRVRCQDSHGNWGDWSEISSFIIEIPPQIVENPAFNPLPGTFTAPQNVTISCATPGTDIYYTTNGADPTQSSTKYTGAVTISSTTTLKARAYRTGWTPSAIASGTYTITGTVAAPTFNPEPGTYTSAQNVTISCATAGATIRYTTNGSDPTETSAIYSGALTVPLNTTMTIKARAYKTGSTPSSIATGTYTITGTVATPVFNPLPGTFAGPQSITITCATTGATVYYTIDGAEPSQSSARYTAPVTISTTATLKARAYKTDWTPSAIASGDYTININTAPIASFTVDPTSGTTLTIFTMNASNSTDDQDSPAALQVRWDWENDGVWDTEFTTTKTATHQYNSVGTKTVKLEVKDSGELTNITTHQLNISAIETGTVTDIDGNTYQTVKIGEQWWMAENLKVTHYQNGDPIPDVIEKTEWSGLTTGAHCYYYNNFNFANLYGALYNWHVVNDNRNIAPDGWHVPSNFEWQTLIDCLGGNTISGGKLKESGFEHWVSPNTGATNESGFTSLPSGYRRGYNDDYYRMDSTAYYWSATEGDNFGAWYSFLSYDESKVDRANGNKHYGFSIRCVMDTGIPATLSFIKITPEPTNIYNEETCQFNCMATYSDLSNKNATQAVTWSVSPGIAGSIDGNGLFTAHANNIGTETITATYYGHTDQVTVTVLAPGTIIDIDGNIYRTVQIGDQVWMAENLKVTHYRNGDELPNVTDNTEWSNLSTGAWCYYNNNESYVPTYGRLYNWYSVIDSRHIAPSGWHVPTDADWQTLVDYLGGNDVAGGKLKETGTTHWNSPNEGATNSSGFTARPGGWRHDADGYYVNMCDAANFWAVTGADDNSAWRRWLSYSNSTVNRLNHNKRCGFSIRCLRD